MDFSARTAYLVAYDISNARRLARTRKVLLGFGVPVQLSVFRCELTRQELVQLKAALLAEIDALDDQVIFADLGPADGHATTAVTSLGRAYERAEHRAKVI